MNSSRDSLRNSSRDSSTNSFWDSSRYSFQDSSSIFSRDFSRYSFRDSCRKLPPRFLHEFLPEFLQLFLPGFLQDSLVPTFLRLWFWYRSDLTLSRSVVSFDMFIKCIGCASWRVGILEEIPWFDFYYTYIYKFLVLI